MKHEQETIKVAEQHENACLLCVYSDTQSNTCHRDNGCGTDKMNEYYVLPETERS